MSSDGGSTAAAVSSAISSSNQRHTVPVPSAISAAIISSDQRHTAPEPRRWKGYWTRYWCFKSQKRDKRIVPAARPHGASDSSRGGWLPAQAVLALVPPSSPASFVNSSVHSPAASTIVCSPGPPNMYTVGPYAHETQDVSPPVFSAVTTEPSTAAVTPPPELAHLTTPSSPDVPFAQYIASSLEAKAAARDTISPLSTSALASPCDTPASHTPTLGHVYMRRGVRETVSPRSTSSLASPCDTPASYTPTSGHLHPIIAAGETVSPHSLSVSPHSLSMLASPCDTPASYTPKSSQHYLGSPINCLVSSSMCKEDAFPAKPHMATKVISPFPSFDPFFSPNRSHTPFASLILPCDSMTEDSSASFISESPNCEDLATTSMPKDAPVATLSEVQISEAGGHFPGSEEELHQRCLQGVGMVCISSEDCSRVHDGVRGQTDVKLSTPNTRENESCTEGVRSQKSSSCDLDEKRETSFSANRAHEDQSTSVGNAYHFQTTRGSSSMRHEANEGLVQACGAHGSAAHTEHG